LYYSTWRVLYTKSTNTTPYNTTGCSYNTASLQNHSFKRNSFTPNVLKCLNWKGGEQAEEGRANFQRNTQKHMDTAAVFGGTGALP